MALNTIKIKVRFAWWWRLYFYGVVTTCQIMGTEPDIDKVKAVMLKALRTEVA